MRYAFVIDHSRCIGCHACSLACKAEHNVPVGSYRTWVKYVEKGSFPDVRRFFTVLRCNHCDDAPCMTICPVTALFRRDNGIVDFDRGVCIGCKACMQACPYDALYIHPDHGTAEKCNFCAHRVENDMEPPCATVCPTESIVVGDIDDPRSRVSQLITTQRVSVRKPEKGTRPKVFYIQGEPSGLTPGAADPSGGYMWADRPGRSFSAYPQARFAEASRIGTAAPSATPTAEAVPAPAGEAVAAPAGDGAPPDWSRSGVSPAAVAQANAAAARQADAEFYSGAWASLRPARTVYDVAHAETPWGWKVSAYLWTILTRPNWDSWLARGAFIIAAFGALAVAWTGDAIVAALGAGPSTTALSDVLRWPLIGAALATAGYSGYLFAQARGRDFWQSPLLPLHLVVQAVGAGAAATVLALSHASEAHSHIVLIVLVGALALHLALVVFGELTISHPTRDGAAAAHAMVRGAYARIFWSAMGLAGIAIGAALWGGPLGGGAVIGGIAGLAAVGLYEHAWNLAGQAPPLS